MFECLGRGDSVDAGRMEKKNYRASGDVRLLFFFVPFRFLHVVHLEEACRAWPIFVSVDAIIKG